MKKYFWILLIALYGCAHYEPGVRFMYVGEHGVVHEANCHGRWHSMGECYQLANNICPAGFEILHKSEKTFNTTSYEEDDDGDEIVDVSTGVDRTLLFYCKD